MNSVTSRKKSVTLIFRGFDMKAEDVVRLVGGAASCGNRGEPVKPGVSTLLSRSYARFSMDFTSDDELNDMLPALLALLGGGDRIRQLREQVQPEFLEFHVDLPARTSEDSQEGYLDESVIASLFQLKATISFGFF
ncbi:hypothetical protein ACFJIX_14350 [Roseateles sp. UC29_93]|uniref:hypothetical protein n=1 Tax=Roseateles sp. UC29_93 TaxID=3350177 RepID=UPI00366A856B